MTFTKSVVAVWNLVSTQLLPPDYDSSNVCVQIPPYCIQAYRDKLQEMVDAGQTDGINHWQSHRMSMHLFTDQPAAEEFVDYLTGAFPCSADIKSIRINNLHPSSVLANPPGAVFPPDTIFFKKLIK